MNFRRIDKFLDNLQSIGVAGTDCCIYLGNELVHRHMNGFANLEKKIPISENILYRMFSMTKPVTCVAMMQLYEQGKFLMTDPVSSFLPEFADMYVTNCAPHTSCAITMHQLFTMTSGLGYNLHSLSLQKLYIEKPNYTTREFVQTIAKDPLLYPPGERWFYSFSHDVLAACVEVISGMRFSEYLHKNIFEPLEMKDCYFWLPDNEIERSCVCYQYDASAKTFTPNDGDTDIFRFNEYQQSPNCESGGAGLTTTLDEYSKFARMLTNLGVGPNGVRILSSNTVDMMRENHLTSKQQPYFDMIQHVGYGYGLGMRTLVDRAAAGALSAVGEFGWSGAGGTYFICDPINRLTVVYAQEVGPDSKETYIHPRLRNVIYSCLDE